MIELILISLIVLFIGLNEYRRRYIKPSHMHSSLLLTYYTYKAQIMPGNVGSLGHDIDYISFIVSNTYTAYVIYLPFTSKIRLLAIPASSNVKINPSGRKSNMEAVDLEGDFYKFFTLYANKGQQADVRYIMDPMAMKQAIEMCKNYNWELINNELIILAEKLIDIEMINLFISEIRPVVEIPASEVDKNVKSEYKFIKSKNLGCPVCGKKTVKNNGNIYSCPEEHGHVMTGKELSSLSNLLISNESKIENNNLKCPNCAMPLVKVKYNGGKVIIDSCVNCPYRWIDNDEVKL